VILYGFFLLTYITIWAVFVLTVRATGTPWPGQVGGMDLLLLCLATFRMTSVVTEEKVARIIRAPFCERVTKTKPDGTVEEEEVPKGKGLRRVAGELILCPWCAGIWIATALTYFWILLPGVARVLLVAFGVAAGGLLFQIFAKLMDSTRTSLSD